MITKNIKLQQHILPGLFSGVFLLIFILSSCKKQPVIPPAAQADYKIEVRFAWASPNFTVPANAHFTQFIGMLHQKNSFLWEPNGLATGGLEDLAEVGSKTRLNNEIDSIIAGGKAMERFVIAPPAITAGFDTGFVFTLNHPCISFASMIAPSPDWFVGINQYSLLQNDAWVNDITVPLYLYDAGTEDGDIFGYDNPASVPLQPVRLLIPARASVLANGNASFAPIGTIRFIKR